jgi:RNA exonuclease 1
MFTTRGLFRDIPCQSGCNHSFCLFSHVTVQGHSRSQSIPAKRPPPDQASRPSPLPRQSPSSSRQSSSHPENVERPTKLQRVGSVKRPAAVPTASTSSTTGVPILTINAGQSKIPVSTRQVCHSRVCQSTCRPPVFVLSHALSTLSLSLLHAHISLSLSTLPYQEHVDIVV